MFGSEKITILLLSNNRLEIGFYRKKGNDVSLMNSYEIKFSDSEVVNNKIADPTLFQKKLTSFLDEKKIDFRDTVLVLPDDATFIKGLKLVSDEALYKLKQNFVSEIPYQIQDLALKTLIDNGNAQLIAVEKDLVSNLRTAFIAEMADVKTIVSLPRVLAVSYPQNFPAILFFKLDLKLTAVLVKGKTVLFSETRSFENDNDLAELVVSVAQEITSLFFTETKPKILFLNIDESLVKDDLNKVGFQIGEFDKISPLEVVAKFWFTNRNEAIVNDLTVEDGNQEELKRVNLFNSRIFIRLSKLGIFFVVILGAGFLAANFIIPTAKKFVQEQKNSVAIVGQQQTQNTQATSSSLLPTTSSASEINKSDFKVEVLNGNGIRGDAARVKAILEKEGFLVVNVGNADRSDYYITELNTKPAVPKDLISVIDNLLKDSYTQIRVATLSANAEVDIRIIIGTKK
ncbi:MAG: LytR C-terminal domain-containing protein [Nitrososphaerota archaeon]